ncbi:MAG: YidC/Oxa1 family insertase periplasmic-domain containing protein [Planctomycetes bacterium]|nr:YidC/Oxa1 family insertase periplasmic-domain containing protein [Planctomycetota bacterium]
MTQPQSSDSKASRQVMWQALLWAMTAFLAWTYISQWIWPSPPESAPADGQNITQQTADPGNGAGGNNGQAGSPIAPPVSGKPSQRVAVAGALSVSGGDTVETLVLGAQPGDTSREYPVGVTVSSLGASVESVTLTYHHEHVGQPEPYALLHPIADADGEIQYRSFTLEKIFFIEDGKDDQEFDLASMNWNFKKESIENGESVVCWLDVTDDEQPVARITMTYEVHRQPEELLQSDLLVELSVDNLTDTPFEVRWVMHGPVGVQRADSRFDDRNLFTAVRQPDATEPEVEMFRITGTVSDEDRVVVRGSTSGDFFWGAVANKFFTAVWAPVSADDAGRATYLNAIERVSLNGAPGAPSTIEPAVTLRYISRDTTIDGGTSASFPMECYLGAKSRAAFETVPEYVARNYFAQIPASYQIGPCAFFTPTWLVQLMIRLLGWFHAVVFNYGVAIILLVVVVRGLLHPLTKRTQVNMMRMQQANAKLAPKIEELKRRFGNDKTRFHQEQMALMRESGINPATQMFSCLPMVIQMPIWIALYTSLNYNIDMRHQPFFLWINDLTVPDGLIHLFDAPGKTIPLIGMIMGPITTFNLLPILLAISMYAQQKLMPRPKPNPQADKSGVDQAAQMQKMMPLMSIMFAFFLYNMPSGLTLYIMASTLFGTLEQLHIRRHIREEEARGGPPPKKPKPAKRSGPGVWQKLQKMAEEAQHAKKKTR